MELEAPVFHRTAKTRDGTTASSIDVRRDARKPDGQLAIPVHVAADPVAPEPDLLVRPRCEWLSRAANAAIAGAALVVLSPVMLMVAVAVKLTSPGPVFYRQSRIGVDRRGRDHLTQLYNRRGQNLGGQPFMIYKFRSMTVGAERGRGAVWASKNDVRVTRVGRVIRKTRLDELPQLINVVKGDMNIVGPRPERPSIFQHLSREIDTYALRQRAKPGITGLAQISQSYDSCVDDVRRKVAWDLEYLRRQSLMHDLAIMARTVPVILFRKGGW